ncbi:MULTISPECIES: hypothetical protein [Cupriavidus]|jgi:hypothetical protein|uniref:hypothetical protein n=1 Tax=Cupriavidus TaxID=106589 RepID=UPI000579275C|nr:MULTISPECIES: hypothetical protein [Cupriavidus]KWR80331.1 hypothetical protein RN01_19035 [Cupriavidus sp. SHE]QWC87724.1 hypothetical protein KB891_11790 [Cupriavidus metallidurans]
MSHRPFSHAALVAEFLRIQGSGIAEEEVKKPAIRKALIRLIAMRLKAQRAANHQRDRQRRPAIDLKRLQANDLD